MSTIDQICNYISESASLADCQILEKAIRERKASQRVYTLDLNKVQELVSVSDHFPLFGAVVWKKEIICSLLNRVQHDFVNFFNELVPVSGGLTNKQAANRFNSAFNCYLQAQLQAREAELEATKPQSPIVVVYNPETDRYESRYREATG